MLAHDEPRTGLLQALQDGVGAEVPISHPYLLGLCLLQQWHHDSSLALVGVLARGDVAHQSAVRVVDHQRMARQRRATQPTQRAQPFLARRQVVAIEHAQLPTRQAGLSAQRACHRRQSLGAALHQRAQDRRLRSIDLVVQGGKRHRQLLIHLARRCVQRWPQPQAHQRHEFHHGGEQQLARVLALAVFVKHLVDPICRNCPLQCQARHHACRRVTFKSFNNSLPDFLLPISIAISSLARSALKTLKGVPLRP